MGEIAIFVALLTVYLVVVRWVLPRFGFRG